MTVMAKPPFGTRTVRELNGSWTVVVDGRIVASGCTFADAVAIEAAEIAATSPCVCGSTAGDAFACVDCGREEW